MGKLLYLQASPRGERSISVAAADAFVNAYRRAHPADEIKALNLFRTDLPPFDGFTLNAKYAILNGLQHTREEQAAWGKVAAVADEFKAYDKYVLAVPMWNFSIPYKLKHYLDVLIQPGLTFSFSPESGYKGLVTGKPIFLALARGGEYPPGSPAEVSDYVLGKPSGEDRAQIDDAIGRSIEVLPLCLAGDLQGAMQKLHSVEKESKPTPPKAAEKAPEPKAEGKALAKPEPGPEPKLEPKPAAAREKHAEKKGLFGSLFGRKK